MSTSRDHEGVPAPRRLCRVLNLFFTLRLYDKAISYMVLRRYIP